MDIWQHVGMENSDAADRLMDRLRARVEMLQQFPHAGMARPDIRADARMLVEMPFLILSRAQPDTVQVVRALHGARDVVALDVMRP